MRWTEHRVHLILLLLFAVMIVCMRLHTYTEPLERDLDIYAWIGHYLLQGRSLYTDLIDIKPPAIFVTYALAEFVVGMGPAQAYLLGVVAAIATLLGLYWLGARSLQRPWLGISAAACWTLLCSDLDVQANQPNTEVFINATMVWGVALLWGLPTQRIARTQTIICGLLFALASLYKPVVIAPVALLALVHLARAFQLAESRRNGFIQIALIAAIGALSWALVLGWFWLNGNFAEAWQMLFVYPGEYVRHAGRGWGANLLSAYTADYLLPKFFIPHALILFASVAAALLGLGGERRQLWLGYLVWLLGTHIAMAMPGRFFPHYYQLLLPLVCFAAALMLDGVRDKRIATVALIVFLAAWGGYRVLPQYQLDARAWSDRKYGSTFDDCADLGLQLRSRLKPEQTLFVYGMLPGIYRYAEKEPPTGVMNLWLTFGNYGYSLSPRLSSMVLGQLQKKPPDMVVIDDYTWQLATPSDPIRHWVQTNYRVIDTQFGMGLAVPRETTSIPSDTSKSAP